MTIRLILIDDHSVVRRGLRSYLESFPDMKWWAKRKAARRRWNS